MRTSIIIMSILDPIHNVAKSEVGLALCIVILQEKFPCLLQKFSSCINEIHFGCFLCLTPSPIADLQHLPRWSDRSNLQKCLQPNLWRHIHSRCCQIACFHNAVATGQMLYCVHVSSKTINNYYDTIENFSICKKIKGGFSFFD